MGEIVRYPYMYPRRGIVFSEQFRSQDDMEAHAGVLVGTPIVSDGKITFTGTEYVNTQQSFQGIFSRSFSVRVKITFTDGNPANTKQFFGTSDGSSNYIRIDCTNTGSLTASLRSNGNQASAGVVDFLDDGPSDELELIMTVDASVGGADGLLFYIDGVQAATGSTAGVVSSEYANQYPLFLGARNNGGLASSYIEADMSLFEIYDRALTADEVALLYAGSLYAELPTDGLVGLYDFTRETTQDLSGEENHPDDVANIEQKRQGLWFDGSTSYVTLPLSEWPPLDSSGFTVLFIAGPPLDTAARYTFYAKRNAAPTMTFYLRTGAGSVTAAYSSDSAKSLSATYIPGTIYTASVASGGDLRLYVNEKLDDSLAIGSYVTDALSVYSLGNVAGFRWLGLYQVCVIWNRELTGEEVAQAVHYWKMRLGFRS